MHKVKKISLVIMMMALCMSLAALSGCEYSATHESETNVSVSTGDDEADADTPVGQAAQEISDYLEDDWESSFHVSYTDDDGSDEANTVYVQFWKNGIGTIDNIDELTEVLKDYNGTFAKILEDKGIENGHVYLQILVGVDDDDSYMDGTSVLDVQDGEVVYDASTEE